ncbi:MAG: hypothetical protein B5M53_05985 [Candidatus Cloacimonas sp. 4484_209]|nr:MAG: hypothetical protein B5M53_05985 [Candidatus Cloacimonas sp. 4484_209]
MISIIYPLLFLSIVGNDTQLISNNYFDIYFPKKAEKLAYLVNSLSIEEFERISRNLHLQGMERINISIITEDKLKKHYGSFIPEWGIGFAIPDENLIILRYPVSFMNPSRLKFIVAHEIAHILIHRISKTSIDRWFDEGCAVYLSREPNFIDDVKLSIAVIFKEIIPLKKLTKNFPISDTKAQLAYIESASTIEYLIDEFGPNIINQILEQTKNMKNFNSGFLIATGLDLETFEIEWKNWLRHRFALSLFLKPNIIFLVVTILVIIIGIKRKLQRGKMRSSVDEITED